MEVALQVSGLIEKSLGFRERMMTLPEGTTVEGLVKGLGLKISVSWLLVSVNGKMASQQKTLCEGDLISILPICGGG